MVPNIARTSVEAHMHPHTYTYIWLLGISHAFMQSSPYLWTSARLCFSILTTSFTPLPVLLFLPPSHSPNCLLCASQHPPRLRALVHAGFVKDLDLGPWKSLAGFLFTKPYLLHPALSEEQVLVKQTLVRGQLLSTPQHPDKEVCLCVYVCACVCIGGGVRAVST